MSMAQYIALPPCSEFQSMARHGGTWLLSQYVGRRGRLISSSRPAWSIKSSRLARGIIVRPCIKQNLKNIPEQK